jgi:hypothetical protein
MLTSITLTTGTGLTATTSTPKTGKLVRAFIQGGDGTTSGTVKALAGNNLPESPIYTPSGVALAAGVEIGMPDVVYFAEQHFELVVTEVSSVTLVLIIDTDG